MKKPKCPNQNCSGTRIDTAGIYIAGVHDTMHALYCSECGAIVGFVNDSLNKKLDEILSIMKSR